MSNAHIQTAMPVPDLDVMANLLQGVTDQVRHCQRLPTFDSGAAILQAINQLQDSVARMDDKIDNNHRILTDKIAQVDRKIDNVRDTLSIEIEAVGRRVMISDHNHTARLENNGADKASAAITALKNVHTGEDIDPFPATAGAAAQLAGTDVGRILAELGMSTRGTASQKKQRMLLAIGVITRSGFGPIQ